MNINDLKKTSDRKKNKNSQPTPPEKTPVDVDMFDRDHLDDPLADSRFSDEVLSVCAINATLRTEGVAGLHNSVTDEISKRVRGKDSNKRGIRINQTEKGVEVDVYVNIDFGAKIPSVAWDIQKNVKQELETITELPVSAVNIYVQGVKTEEDDQDDE